MQPFTGVGAVMLVLAASDRWNGARAAGALLLATLAWLGAAWVRQWRAALWAAAGTFVAAAYHVAECRRGGTAGSRRSLDHGRLSVWGLVGVGAVGAYLAVAPAQRSPGRAAAADSLAPGFAIAAATALFLGVTVELDQLCSQQLGSAEAARLASGLSISAWWILFAAAVVLLGFRRGMPRLRVAGLGVAAAAVAKVLFSDLASLDAFYRIGSVFILGIVSLALAWLYHRQARANTESA